MKKFKAGIAGAAGYTGGELIRLLLNHPEVEIAFVHSKSQTGKPVYSTHTDLVGDTDLVFTDTIQPNVDVLFLCMGHGQSAAFLSENPVSANTKIIDLSHDFRNESNGFIYGLPELKRNRIKEASKIANPGCFATAIQLALLPLAEAGQLTNDVHVSAVTGSTGAGQSLSETSHFSWRSNNISIYKAFTHQHLAEIKQSLGQQQGVFDKSVFFIPYRGSFTRGILASCYLPSSLSLEEAKGIFKKFYADHPFTHVSDAPIDVKQVVNTNKCLLHIEKHEGQLLITSAIDNLLKGASGQAVQNMNLVLGIHETTGLNLKPVAF